MNCFIFYDSVGLAYPPKAQHRDPEDGEAGRDDLKKRKRQSMRSKDKDAKSANIITAVSQAFFLKVRAQLAGGVSPDMRTNEPSHHRKTLFCYLIHALARG